LAKVLIADDDPDSLKLLVEILEDHGHVTVVARDGAEALDRAALERPEIILLDVTMPELDGVEVCGLLKQDRDLQHIPVILVTARNSPQQMVAGLHAGARDYITKPFREEILLGRVQAALRH
jgi:DNA-binding response OmpR family regulator